MLHLKNTEDLNDGLTSRWLSGLVTFFLIKMANGIVPHSYQMNSEGEKK